jgi:hypothetical protein
MNNPVSRTLLISRQLMFFIFDFARRSNSRVALTRHSSLCWIAQEQLGCHKKRPIFPYTLLPV